uniref:Putative secreted peptide n=1 Tax=Anopheles braziliensis TaxID=58242 RepID=A0A2M3ZU70_9DIPT
MIPIVFACLLPPPGTVLCDTCCMYAIIVNFNNAKREKNGESSMAAGVFQQHGKLYKTTTIRFKSRNKH